MAKKRLFFVCLQTLKERNSCVCVCVPESRRSRLSRVATADSPTRRFARRCPRHLSSQSPSSSSSAAPPPSPEESRGGGGGKKGGGRHQQRRRLQTRRLIAIIRPGQSGDTNSIGAGGCCIPSSPLGLRLAKKKVGKRFESGADEGMLFWGEGAGGRPGVSDFVSG